ncbi:unnamed protein product [Didymodactylos carnosus]|uniref:Uncharacterized protein n=1 Tax=Didymodactylos carnosus TaxID=1234261 RepID=A0A8S2E8H6_9BILA|nr:unnamed protein product [Didymodactylos carnosus]CAF3964103.1 unnamed protein product [Didymodactylos carnosus]
MSSINPYRLELCATASPNLVVQTPPIHSFSSVQTNESPFSFSQRDRYLPKGRGKPFINNRPLSTNTVLEQPSETLSDLAVLYIDEYEKNNHETKVTVEKINEEEHFYNSNSSLSGQSVTSRQRNNSHGSSYSLKSDGEPVIPMLASSTFVSLKQQQSQQQNVQQKKQIYFSRRLNQ